MSASTFPALLAEQLRADPARPLVTFYDDATGERIELSVTTYANWVAKTAGLLQDELDVERGGTVLVDLPTHWLGPVWLGAAWTVGLAVTDDLSVAGGADVVVCGPDTVERHSGAVSGGPLVLALSLRPLGLPFAEALPPGVIDYAAVVLGQPDSFAPLDPPSSDDLAWRGAHPLTQAELLGSARAAAAQAPAARLLTDVNPCSADGIGTLLDPLAAGGGTVWVRHPAAGSWDHRAASERATRTLHA